MATKQWEVQSWDNDEQDWETVILFPTKTLAESFVTAVFTGSSLKTRVIETEW